MDTLILAQTIFYFVVSLALISMGVLFSVVAYHLVHVAKNIRSISKDLSDGSEEVKIKVIEIVDRLSQISFLSFLKSKPKKHEKSQK